ncbi:UNVERIFIED_ORG: hypothetical protein Xoosp15_205 [Xanthomonas phage Xoo-sp15]
MDFIKELKEEFIGMPIRMPFIDENQRFRRLEGIEFNQDVTLSVQASFHAYCAPRETTYLQDYESMEMAIIKGGEFVSLTQLLVPHVELMKELDEYFEGEVYPYVPVELIERVYHALLETFGRDHEVLSDQPPRTAIFKSSITKREEY